MLLGTNEPKSGGWSRLAPNKGGGQAGIKGFEGPLQSVWIGSKWLIATSEVPYTEFIEFLH